MRPYHDVRTIVAVKVNGAGPYDFLVDTGATGSLVDSALFETLGLRAEDSVTMNDGTGAASRLVRTTVNEISVGGASVKNLTVASLKSLPMGQNDAGVRGILGENFLQHFDILIDNQRHQMTLDGGSGLAGTLAGERLPIVFPAPRAGEEMRYRPMVSVTVPGYGTDPLTVLLDSGTDRFVLVGTRIMAPMTAANSTRVVSANGEMICAMSEDKMHWGKSTISGVAMTTCRKPGATVRDHDGNLPTSIFKQIFISHAGAYAIVNPVKQAPAPQEIAAVTPLAR